MPNRSDSEGEHQHEGIRAVQRRTPLPKLQLFILLFIQLAEPVTALVIYPFIIQFVRDTGVTGGDESQTGYFAGLIESIFFLTECLTVVYFGRASDRYGRRPVLLLGPLGLALSMVGFGLSKRFWSLVVFRCFQGAFNGNLGVAKSVMAEISDSTNIAQMYTYLPFTWTIGATIGPLIGGTLANPAAHWPNSLGKIDFLREYPYFLPCFVAGLLAFLAFVTAFLALKETLPSAIARQKKLAHGTESELLLPEDSLSSSAPTATQDDEVPPLRDLFTRPVRVALLNHAFLCFCQMCFDVLNPLVYATPIEMGGLGMSPFQIGRIMGTCGFVNVFVQLFLAAKAIKRFGPHRIFTTTFCSLSLSFLAYPLLNFFARRAGGIDIFVITTIILQMSSSLLLSFAYACTHIFIVDSAPTRNSLGGVNGIAQMVSSTLRSLAPSIASSLFATSIKHNLLHGNFVFAVLFVITLIGLRATFLLPKRLRSEGGS
ncbi:major facilitator superfamily multidrug-resistance, DHA1 sub-family [Mycena rebaudengoi]|nr:major facilitator superfamily multidrug-resistance, DHA1 sub-family [Mycena rebaudengoi]